MKDPSLEIKMAIQTRGESSTLVTISEGSRANDEEGIKWLKGNTAGTSGL